LDDRRARRRDFEDNLNPVGRMYFATMIFPTSLDQPVRAAFGAQAGGLEY
jgi:hypothetical protein